MRSKLRYGILLSLTLLLGACTAGDLVKPILKQTLRIAVQTLGGDIIYNAAQNHSPSYAGSVENLLLALVKEVGGLDVHKAGTGPYDGGEYQSEDEGSDDEEYDDEEYDDEDSDGEEYEDSADDEYEEESSEGDTEYEDDEGVDEEYENDVSTDDGGEFNEENSAVDDYQDDGSDVAADDQAEESASQNAASTKRKLAAGSSGTNRKLQSSTNRKRRSGLAEINFDFTLLKKQGDSSVTIDDGDILYDMDGAESGDKFKVNFSTDCKCYVYIVGIDTTGFVATIFPDEESNAFNPAVPDKQYELPAGNTWWGLDTNRGVETIYLIISREQRDDIDALLLSLSEMPATESRSADGPTIKQTMIAEMRRGLKKVKVNVQNSSGIRSSVDRYVARLKDVDADVVVSRWFEHQ